MEIEPRPVEVRHAFLGGVLIVGSASTWKEAVNQGEQFA